MDSTMHLDLFHRLAPFHFVVNQSLDIIQMGTGLQRLLDSNTASKLGDFLQVITPTLPSLSFHELSAHSDDCLLIEFPQTGGRLRGQFNVLSQEDSASSSPLGLLCLTPLINSMGELPTWKVGLKDFALHDRASDFLFLLQTQKVALAETKAMADELHHKHEELQSATQKIQQHSQDLEHLVEERTTKLRQAQRQLVDASRQAGMADIATGILHNVGNVLNSTKVSASVLQEKLGQLETDSLVNLVELLTEHTDNLGEFLTADSTGQQILPFLKEVSQQFTEDQQLLIQEITLLQKHVEHIRSIITSQQKHAKRTAVQEAFKLRELIDDALQMAIISYGGGAIEVVRIYDEDPTITTDHHQVLQILSNLLHNARHALRDGNAHQPRIEIHLKAIGEDQCAVIVEDNGIGITNDALSKIFEHGFTTKHDGNGYGLHTAVLAAKELGGSLTVSSKGKDQGATFTLVLPHMPPSTTENTEESTSSHIDAKEDTNLTETEQPLANLSTALKP